jgi:hypothetical protein
MPRFLVSIHHPDTYEPFKEEDDQMDQDIDALNDEMVAAGVRVFVGGLHPAKAARSVVRSGDEVKVVEGPYLKTDEHVGGCWVLEVADIEAALTWGRKAAIACRAPVEVRQFY